MIEIVRMSQNDLSDSIIILKFRPLDENKIHARLCLHDSQRRPGH